MHKNFFTRLITLGIIFLSMITVGYAVNRPEWGNLRTGLILKYRLPKGQTLTYRNGSVSLQNVKTMGRTMKTTMKADVKYGIKGTGFDDKNNLMVQININDINFAIKSPRGNINPDTSGLKGKSFGATFSPNGKQLKLTGVESLPKIILGPGVNRDVKDIFEGILPRLPDVAVKTGESWTTPIDKNIPQGRMAVTMKGEATSALEGIETIQGMECVKIKTQTKYTVEGSRTRVGQTLNLKGDGKATSTWYFAYKRGCLVKLTSTDDANIKISVGKMEITQTTKTKDEIGLVH